MMNVLVIPFYNESSRIKLNLFEILLNLSPSNLEIVLVDDGSSDNTKNILETISKLVSQSDISVRTNNLNLGKAETLRLIFKEYSEKGYDILAFTDGDLATPPQEIIRFLELASRKQTSVLMGVRKENKNNRINVNQIRRLQGMVFTKLTRKILGFKLTDSQCGMKAFENSEICRIALIEPFLNPWLFELEIFLRMGLHLNEENLGEEILQEWNHVRGSKIKLSDPLKMLISLLILKRKYLTHSS